MVLQQRGELQYPHSYGEKATAFYQQELPDLTEEALKIFALPGPADQHLSSRFPTVSTIMGEIKKSTKGVLILAQQKRILLVSNEVVGSIPGLAQWVNNLASP